MSSTAISAAGINELFPILIFVGVCLVIVLIAILFWSSGSLSNILNGIDRKKYEQLVYDNIPKLREIANLYPNKLVGIEARKFLERWDIIIEPSLERLDRSKKREKLRTVYQSNIQPILEAYERMITQEETIT